MKYSMDFTEQELQIIISALHEMPVRYAMPVIHNIQHQIVAQLRAMKEIKEVMDKSKE